jgi:hypothetical protein
MVLELAPYDEELSAEFDAVVARWRAALVLSRAARGPAPFRSTVDALTAIVDHEATSQPVVSGPRRRPARRQGGV